MKHNFLISAAASILSLASAAQTPMCPPPSASATLDVNNVSALIQNGGDMWWDLVGLPRYQVPKNSGRSTFFTQALWVGGINPNDSISLAGMRYRAAGVDFFPGPLNSQGTTTDSACAAFDRIFEMTSNEVEEHLAGLNTSNAVLEWPGRGNPNNNMPLQDLAPFNDVNNDGIYNANDGDYPLIKGDQALWYVFNDAGNLHTATGGEKIGIEVQVMAYAFKGDSHEDNATFYDYKIMNKGESLSDAYFSLFTDTDLGNPQDDYVGCDTLRDLGIVYNGDLMDEDNGGSLGYGTNPPLAGVRLLESRLVMKDSLMHMTNFGAFNNDRSVRGDPTTARQYYNYMQSIWRNNTHFHYGGTGVIGAPNVDSTRTTDFLYSGNPSDTSTWTECSARNTPFDRRMLMSVGPFPFASGEVIEFTSVAIFVQPDQPPANNCADFSLIAEASDYLKSFHDSVNNMISSVPSNGEAQLTRLNIYPNPATDQITLEGMETQGEYQIFSLSGQYLQQGQIKAGSQQILVSDFRPGVYFLKVATEQESITKKLIIH